MAHLPHTAVFTDNHSRKSEFAQRVLEGHTPAELGFLKGLKGGFFSNESLAAFLEEEARHESSELQPDLHRPLQTYSSGERKKALLRYLLYRQPGYLILDDPFDNLDRAFQAALRAELERIAQTVILIQLVSRPSDRMAFISQTAFLQGTALTGFPDYEPASSGMPPGDGQRIPPAPYPLPDLPEVLVDFRNASLSYPGKSVLKNIDWTIRQGDFWELRGPNGSGKTSLITLISGDNPKAYGMELYLFGARKGSGESVWDIKEHIGYFTPALADRFKGYHTVENMLISGLTDSIGLYVKPGDTQRALAADWLRLLGMEARKDTLFCDLTAGEQRLVFCARAMIKHPPLLILDEPTAGLDPQAAALVVALIRKMAEESQTALVFVSHRDEPGLHADGVFELIPGPGGSKGKIWRNRP